MNIAGITQKPFVLTLFKRDDDERFLLGAGEYEFKSSQLHFSANTIINDAVDAQGSDGSFLAGQVRRAQTQSFDGYVGDGTTTKTKVEELRIDFLKFFSKNHFYTAVYLFPDGTAIQRQRGYLVDAPEVQELYQDSPEYHIALTFEDVNYYRYQEDEDGNEIFSNSARLVNKTVVDGGVVWDSVGATWDSVGLIWAESSGGGPAFITNNSIQNVFPTITTVGVAENPTWTNVSTGQTLKYSGTIASGQTLVIDTNQKTAKLNGTTVLQNISGDWLELAPGVNHVTYTTTSTDTSDTTIAWQEVVG